MKTLKILLLPAIFACVSVFFACSDDGPQNTQLVLPVVITNAATDITHRSATLGGNIINVGIPAYTERGFCYSTSPNPTTSGNKIVVDGTGTGNFIAEVGNFDSNTTYYVRAYAINSDGTVYGNEVSFKTLNPQ